MTNLLALIILLAAIPVAGLVASKLYDWHVRSVFSHAPIISTGRMVGLMCLVAVISGDFSDDHTRTAAERLSHAIDMMATVLILLFIGWLAHRWAGRKPDRPVTQPASQGENSL